MAVDVQTEVVIDLPRDQVAEYAIDPSHAPDWYADIESAQWETPAPLGVGSRIAFVARFLGRRLAYTYEIGERLVQAVAVHAEVGDEVVDGHPVVRTAAEQPHGTAHPQKALSTAR